MAKTHRARTCGWQTDNIHALFKCQTKRNHPCSCCFSELNKSWSFTFIRCLDFTRHLFQVKVDALRITQIEHLPSHIFLPVVFRLSHSSWHYNFIIETYNIRRGSQCDALNGWSCDSYILPIIYQKSLVFRNEYQGDILSSTPCLSLLTIIAKSCRLC